MAALKGLGSALLATTRHVTIACRFVRTSCLTPPQTRSIDWPVHSPRTQEHERAIFVTSAGPNDGKTMTSLNLRLRSLPSISGRGRRRRFASSGDCQDAGVVPESGIGDVVTGRVSVADASH